MIRGIGLLLLAGIIYIRGQTEIQRNCDRKNFVVIQDLQYTNVYLNRTVVTPELVSTTCTNSSVPFCMSPYIIETKTTTEYKVTNMFLYEWNPPSPTADYEMLPCGCPKCDLVQSGSTEIPVPFVGCDMYKVTTVEGKYSLPSIATDVRYTYM
jgi:hypothetical protein